MKKRSIIGIVFYVVLIGLFLAWIFGAFSPKMDDLKLSDITSMISNEEVDSFIINGNTIQLKLKAPKGDKTSFRATIGDPEGFLVEAPFERDRRMCM